MKACAFWAILLAIAVSGAKVAMQYSDPPLWARTEAHQFEGFVAIDHFAHRAAYVHDWLAGKEGAANRLAEFLRTDLHPTTLTVPVLTALVAFVVPSIAWSYMLVVSATFAGCVFLAGRLFEELTRSDESRAGDAGGAMLLTATHCLALRTASLLIVDWFVALCTLGTTICALRACRQGHRANWVLCGMWCVLGMFTKLSFVPAMVVPLAAPLLARSTYKARLAGVCAVSVAVAMAWAWMTWLAGGVVLGRDTEHILNNTQWSSSRLVRFGCEMVLLLQVWPWQIARGVWSWPRATVALALVGNLVATWAFKLPAIPRLYVGCLVLLVPLGLAAREKPWSRAGLATLITANVGIALAGLFLGN